MALRKAKLFRCLSISAKNNNKIYRLEDGEVFTEDQVNNFDELLESEAIQLVEEIAPAKVEIAPALEQIAPVDPVIIAVNEKEIKRPLPKSNKK